VRQQFEKVSDHLGNRLLARDRDLFFLHGMRLGDKKRSREKNSKENNPSKTKTTQGGCIVNREKNEKKGKREVWTGGVQKKRRREPRGERGVLQKRGGEEELFVKKSGESKP